MLRDLSEIAKECRTIVVKAVKDLGPDLGGFSVIDSCYDNLSDSDVSTADIKSALVVAGVDSLLSPRLVRSYSK